MSRARKHREGGRASLRLAASWWVAGVLLFSSGPAMAQTSVVVEASGEGAAESAVTRRTTSAQRRARGLVREGETFLEEGEVEAALASFTEAHGLAPGVRTLLGLSRGHEAAGRLNDAMRYAELALQERIGRMQRAEIRVRIAELERDIANERVSSRQDGESEAPALATSDRPLVLVVADEPRAIEGGVQATPLHRQWWFWTVAGVVFVGGVAAGVALATRDETQPFAADDVGGAILTLGDWR